MQEQHAKKVVSSSQELLNFAVRLVDSIFCLSDRQVKFFRRSWENSNYRLK